MNVRREGIAKRRSGVRRLSTKVLTVRREVEDKSVGLQSDGGKYLGVGGRQGNAARARPT